MLTKILFILKMKKKNESIFLKSNCIEILTKNYFNVFILNKKKKVQKDSFPYN